MRAVSGREFTSTNRTANPFHQQINDSSTTNELWIDRVKKATIQSPVDNYHGSPYDRISAGIVRAGTNASFEVWSDEVGFSYVGPLWMPVCQGVNDTLSLTETGIARPRRHTSGTAARLWRGAAGYSASHVA